MKKLLILTGFVLAFQMAKSQEIFTKNRVFVDVQMGLSNIGAMLGGGVQYGVSDNFSVGANFYYQTDKPYVKYFTAWVPEVSVDYHFGKKAKIDFYTGASVGYCFWQSDNSYWKTRRSGGCDISITDFYYNSDHRRDVIYNAHIGFRWFVLKNIGLQAQVGAGNVISIKAGISFKL